MADTGPPDDGGSPAALAAYERVLGHLYAEPSRPESAIRELERPLEDWCRGDRPRHCVAVRGSLAEAYLRRTEGRRRENVEKAIAALQAGRAILEQLPPDAYGPHLEYLLGTAYARRDGDRPENDLASALEHFGAAYQAALALPERDLTGAVTALMGAADAMQGQLADGRLENQERALEVLELARRVLARAGRPEPPELLHTLGNAYLDRLDGSAAENTERAIAAYEASIEATDEGAELDIAVSRQALAYAHLRRGQGDSSENVRRALANASAAAAAARRLDATELLARALHAQADAYAARGEGGRRANLKLAVDHQRQALDAMERAGGDRSAIAGLQNALAYDLAALGVAEGADAPEAAGLYETALRTFTQLGSDDERLRVLQNIAEAEVSRHRWTQALAALEDALATAARLLDSAWSATGRRKEVELVSRLPALAAYCALMLGRPAQALAWLESGRARLLGEALRLSDEALRGLPTERRRSVVAARDEVRRLEAEELDAIRGGVEPFANIRPLLAARRLLDTEMLTASGQPRRVTRPSFDVAPLLEQLPDGSALVAPLVTSAGGACFVVPGGRDGVTPDDLLMLGELTTEAIRDQLAGSRTAVGWMTAYRATLQDKSMSNTRRWKLAIDQVTRWLWDALMGPVDARLRELGLQSGAEILVLPQGGLGVLPLHAASATHEPGARCFLDDWTVRYAPSLEALRTSRNRPDPIERTLLAVIDPSGELAAAPAEIYAITQHFTAARRRVLAGSEAVQDTVLAAAVGCAYVHFASHAIYGWDDPLASRLALHGGDGLDLEEVIAHLDLAQTRLATLSACETGISEFDRQPDEYVGLGAGFLVAGARGVLSSLWAVGDLATALLIARFYVLHLEDGQPPATALASAQRWMREVTAPELADIPWAGMPSPSPILDAYMQRISEIATAMPSLRPFEHPVNWAAFTLTGA